MMTQSIPQLLDQMLGERPTSYLIAKAVRATSAMPADMQGSPSAIQGVLRDVCLHHRLDQCFATHTASLHSEAQSVVERSAGRAEEAAQRMFTRVLDELLMKAARQHPVAEAARTRARREWAAMSGFITILAFAVLYGGMLLHWVPHPSLTARENAQLAWVKTIDGQASRAAIDWAADDLDDVGTLNRMKAYLEAVKAGHDPSAELAMVRQCRLKGMTTTPYNGRITCWFYLP